MQTLRLLKADPSSGGHNGDVFACSYTPDGSFILSAGWDGHLRLWESGSGAQVGSLEAGTKPLSSCAVTPDGQHWLSGSMEGLLARWDGVNQKRLSMFLAHTRPISSIVYAADGSLLATTSWDRQVILWKVGQEREGRTLQGHSDIVAGCRFTPDGKHLVSWSYDGSLRVWEVARAKTLAELQGHTDRVLAGSVCPDGKWLASGSRDLSLRLWDLSSGAEVHSVPLTAEVRACFFLLDGESLVTVDCNGKLRLHSVPDLEVQAELATRLPVQCGELAPGGNQIALGCTDGRVHLVAVDGFDSSPLLVTPTQTSRQTTGVFQRLFGKPRLILSYECTCPACRKSFTVPGTKPGQPAPCPSCHRQLRMSSFIRMADQVASPSRA